MESILRGLVMYVFLLVVFRFTGKRSLGQVTAFDFVILLIIGEAAQNALLGQDYSIVGSFLTIATLLGTDILLSLVKQKSRFVEQVLEDAPIVIVENGKPLKDRMDKERVDESDILEAARCRQGLRRIEEIRYAVLERNGEISIVPYDS